MKKAPLSSGILIFAMMIVVLTLNVRSDALSENTTPQKKAGLIKIDSLGALGDLERAPVLFPHDMHSEKLAATGNDCTACHEKKPSAHSGELIYRFKRFEDGGFDTIRNIYHDTCIRCHEETLSKRKKSGPVSCNACHTRKPEYAPGQAPMGFDNSLHYRHTRAMENKCETCHHEYDPAEGNLIYIKGREGTCRYCHGKTTDDNRVSIQQAFHEACIACHRKVTAQGRKTGPVKCAGCHDPQHQALIATVEDVSRYDRNQPKSAFILPVQTEGKTSSTPPVAFDHLRHEAAAISCRTCHHAEISRCAVCHTADGMEKGGGVSLMQSMHKTGTNQSCFGCHDSVTEATPCAGCHEAMPTRAVRKEEGCAACHAALPNSDTDTCSMTDEEKEALSAVLLARGSNQKPVVSMRDVPEIVTIGSMADQYKAVALPHRKIFAALRKNAAGSRLAVWFHNGDTTLCQGCHHNSPSALKPPGCVSCHSLSNGETHPLMPGLRGAYHQQCIGCHETMNIEKTECTDCHEKSSST